MSVRQRAMDRRAVVETSSARRVVVLTHPRRSSAAAVASTFAELLIAEGVQPVVPEEQRQFFAADVASAPEEELVPGAELVVVLGGDGTILWGAEIARAADVPLLGLNLGHVGFLAEAEENELSAVARAVVARDYRVERRLAIDVEVISAGRTVFESWALNEASIEKDSATRMLDLFVGIDSHPLSHWGADGIVLATPTGSTAYAWSAGGPVVWPDVEALLVVPNSAHALFARPLVLSPECEIHVELRGARPQEAEVWCDGRRHHRVTGGDEVRVRRSNQPVLLARLHSPAFVQRLVGKFHLPVEGWRQITPEGDDG